MNPDHWLASKEHNYQKHQLAQRKEKKLQSVLDKLSNLSKGPKVYKDSVEDLYVEKNQLQSEKTEIERKYKQLLTEYNNLKKRLDQVQEENSKKQKLQEQFKKII